MASCDDDFGLLGDEAQSQQQPEVHHHHHHHHHHQQQQQQHQHQHQQVQQQQQQLVVPFSHRYIAAAAAGLAAAAAASAGKGGVSIHSHARSLPLINNTTIASPKKVASVDEVSYTEAFAQSDVNNPPNHRRHHHCFAPEEDSSFAPQSQGEEEGEDDDDDDEEDGDGDHISREDAAVAGHHPLPSSTRHHLQQQQRQPQPQPQQVDPKRKDREELSDGESPSIYYTTTTNSNNNINNSNNNKKLRPAAAAAVPSSSSGDYRKDREEWSDSAIACLLDAYTEKYIQLNRGNLRGRDWEDVATIVSERCDKHKSGKSVEQCKNKVDNLKKRYKVECQRLISGNLAISHWPWFKKMEQIVGSSSSSNKAANTDDDKSPAPLGASTPTSRQLKRYPVAPPGSASLANNFKMKSVSNPRWKRAVLKISGSALSGTGPQNVDPKVIMLIAREIAMASRVGVEVAIVVGGRNFFCTDTWVAATGTDRAAAYQIGMMASAMSSLLLQASLEKIGIETRVQTSFMMQEIAEPYIRRRAIRHLEKGRVVIFGGISAGLGNPLLTTDTAAALRASEINADVVLKGTNMDGGYECHPRTNSVAFEHISFKELDSRGFSAMDMTAITFCAENNIPVVFFNLLEPGNISRALCGDQVGTLIDQSGRIN